MKHDLIHVPIGDSVSDREVYLCREHALIPTIDTWLDIAAPFHPGSANIQPIKPGCAEQTRSSRACSIILDFFILLLCNTPLVLPADHILCKQTFTKRELMAPPAEQKTKHWNTPRHFSVNKQRRCKQQK